VRGFCMNCRYLLGTRSAIRLMLAAAMLTFPLFSDTLSETFIRNGGEAGVDGSYEFYIPDFNPELGTLDSMTWNVVGSQLVALSPDCSDYNNGVYYTAAPYSYSITSGIEIFGTAVQSTTSGNIPQGTPCPGGGPSFEYGSEFSGSGSVGDPSSFIGTGSTYVPATAISSGAPADPSLFMDTDGPLTVTYTYTSAVPEPSIGIVTLIGSGLALLWRRRKQNDSRETK
jgi:PEP-CTERM motif